MAKQSRRDFLRLGATLTTATCAWSLAGCGRSDSIRAAGFVESQEQLKNTVDVLDLYEKKFPSITISTEFTNYGPYTEKLATQVAGGNPPDLMSTNADLMGQYSRRKILLELDEFVPKVVDLSDYAEGTLQGNTIDGHLYGIPNDCVAVTVVYDTTAFEKAKVKVPQQMWTWEEYEKVSNDISKALGGDFYGTEDGARSYTTCDMFLRGRRKEFYTPEGGLGFDKDDLAEWYGFWDRLRRNGAAPPAEVQALANTDNVADTGLIAGRAAMLPQLTDAWYGLQNLTTKPLGLHMLPNGFTEAELEQHHYAYAGNSSSVSRETEYADQVMQVVRFMHNDPEGVAIYYRGSGLVPASARARAELRLEASPVDGQVLDYMDLILDGTAKPRNPGVNEVSEMLGRVYEDVAFERVGIDEAVDRFFSEAEAALQ